MCKWTNLNDFELWATDCGVEMSEDDRWTLHWELEAMFCPWCGQPIEEVDEETDWREEEAALRRDYWEAVMPR